MRITSDNEIIKVELRRDIPISVIRVPCFEEIEVSDSDKIGTDDLGYMTTTISYVRSREEEGLCGLKYVHFREE